MEGEVVFKVLEFGSQEHRDSIELRRKILRKPLGLDFTDDELQLEDKQFHLAALHKSQVVGILLMKPSVEVGKASVKMRQVAVAEDYQGKGLGSKLVEYAESWSRENNYKAIELHARETVLDFYRLLHYELLGPSFLEVGIPHRRMQKEL